MPENVNDEEGAVNTLNSMHSLHLAFAFVGKSFYEGNLVYFFPSAKLCAWLMKRCVYDVRMFVSAPRE